MLIFAGYSLIKQSNSSSSDLAGSDLLGAVAAVPERLNLGRTAVGTFLDEYNRNAINAFRFVMPAWNGTAESMSVYIDNPEAGTAYSLAIYDDNNGSPANLLARSSEGVVGLAGWHTLPITGNLISGKTYWLSYNTNASTGDKNVLSMTNGNANQHKWHYQTFGTWPSSFGSIDGSGAGEAAMYVTYVKEGSAQVPTGSFDFSLTAPATTTVTVGKTGARARITATKLSGTAVPTTFSQVGVPTGVRASFLPSRCTPTTSCSTVLVLTPSSTAVPGDYSVTIRATAGALVRQATTLVTVVKPGTSISKPGTPVLSLPATGATGVDINPTLSWASSTGAVSYNLQIATDSSFTNPTVVNALTSLSYTPSNLEYNTRYYWRAQAVNTAGLSAWASARSFTTLAEPDQPTDPTIIPGSSTKYIMGSVVRVTGDNINIRNFPGLTGTSILGQQANGTQATVVSGPANASGYEWWKFDFTNGADGWSIENYNEEVSRPGGPVDFPETVLNFNLPAVASVSLTQGSSGSVPVTLNITESNLAQVVTLSVSGLPSGVSGVFNPTSCTSLATGPSTCSNTLGLAALGSAPTGSYNATITANGGGRTATVSLPITITAEPVITPPSTTFNTGDKVEVYDAGNLNIRSTPGGSILATRPDGTTGFVQADANAGIFADDNYWWKVDFGGLVGWGVERFLRLFQLPPHIPSTTSPKIGVNLEYAWESNRAMYFTDLWKLAGIINGSFGADGWPLGDFLGRVISVTDSGNGGVTNIHYPQDTGRYTFTATGRGTVGASGASVISQSYNAATNVTTAIIERTNNTVDMNVGMSNTTGPIRDIKIMRPGYAGSNALFTNEFKTALAPFSVIRFMDWMNTNVDLTPYKMNARAAVVGANNTLEWSERPSYNSPLWLSEFGVPIEAIVQLANETGKTAWINISNYASDDYKTKLAAYLAANLETPLIVEYSNEPWNYAPGFGQYGQIKDAALAHVAAGRTPRLDNPPADPHYLTQRYVLMQLIDLSAKFRAAGVQNVKFVFGSQIGQTSLYSDALNWAARTYPQPVNYYIDMLAGAPYYGGSGATTAELVDSIQTGLDDKTTWKFKNSSELLMNKEPLMYSVAQAYGLDYVNYEAGLDISSDTNRQQHIGVNYDPRMKDITLAHTANAIANGSSLWMQFTLTGAYGKHHWGLTDDAKVLTNPRYAGVLQAVNTDPRRFEIGLIGNGYWGVAPASAVLGPGTGLTGVYRWSEGGVPKSLTRVDKLMQFSYINYQSANPVPRKDVTDNSHKSWSAEWTGQFWPEYTGTYNFSFDGRWYSLEAKVNGVTVSPSGNVALQAGVPVPISIKFSSTDGEGTMRFWQTINGRKTIVKQSQLIP